ncbi:transglutaminase-like domain-containing protein [Cellulosilyticum sp. ST5]|uniref:transglutaminase-like domain-containing protein n=1 Tax=unclassified Cellulosilyticum TaxID=2643091 RepID=UPI000F8EE44D|nr:transglutaminase-like domain-containing protein [Cellulosilyticum sp. WCF-2]QEH69309.1 transglutaminase domain-containing protein [Cellulosilyticum sp. WCF-2]
MEIMPYTNQLSLYTCESDIIDYNNNNISRVANEIANGSNSNIEYIEKAYEYVRDYIFHSADINNDILTCKASEVLKSGHGICFAKSHLLAALLRYKSIPTGFCYQRLILDDDTAPILVYHGLNGIYIEEYHKWIRLDARGNKPGVEAQFSIETEKLAFPVRAEKGEEDNPIVYPEPDRNVLAIFQRNKTRSQLWNDLPTKLAYKCD